MNDEIKEIITRMASYTIHYDCCSEGDAEEDIDKLLDYITNLQQEKDTYKEQLRITHKDLEHYISRCEKAIEYINENKHLSMFADCREPEEDWNYDLECSANDLLNILQGENNGN